jgi:hypothetical protein
MDGSTTSGAQNPVAGFRLLRAINTKRFCLFFQVKCWPLSALNKIGTPQITLFFHEASVIRPTPGQ